MAYLLAEGTQAATSLPLAPAGYALVALGLFAVLLAVTYAFRSIGNRH
jgi:hypothetical protein